jgi:hypothetical protein
MESKGEQQSKSILRSWSIQPELIKSQCIADMRFVWKGRQSLMYRTRNSLGAAVKPKQQSGQ